MEQEELVEYEQKINAILDFGDGKENFSTSFVESIQEQLFTKQYLSDKQKHAINNIIERWGIEL